MSSLAMIPLDRIRIGRRLRETSEAKVEMLVASIGDVGLLNPVTVFNRQVIDAGIAVDGFGLVAGAHRIEACKRLGMTEVAANIVELSDLERQIAECDENLCAATLTPSEKAMFTRRRKEAYEALYPETKAHVAGAHASNKAQGNASANLAPAFTADTAAKTGQSERAVQRDAERGVKISDRALAAVRGTKLDTGKYLDALKALPAQEQVERVKADLAPRKPVPPPAEPHNPQEAYNKWASDMNRIWSRAPQDWRERWIKIVAKPGGHA